LNTATAWIKSNDDTSVCGIRRSTSISIKNIVKNVGDKGCGDRDQDQIRAGDTPFVARMPGQASQQRAGHHFLGDSGWQRLASGQILPYAGRQCGIASQPVVQCILARQSGSNTGDYE